MEQFGLRMRLVLDIPHKRSGKVGTFAVQDLAGNSRSVLDTAKGHGVLRTGLMMA